MRFDAFWGGLSLPLAGNPLLLWEGLIETTENPPQTPLTLGQWRSPGTNWRCHSNYIQKITITRFNWQGVLYVSKQGVHVSAVWGTTWHTGWPASSEHASQCRRPHCITNVSSLIEHEDGRCCCSFQWTGNAKCMIRDPGLMKLSLCWLSIRKFTVRYKRGFNVTAMEQDN